MREIEELKLYVSMCPDTRLRDLIEVILKETMVIKKQNDILKKAINNILVFDCGDNGSPLEGDMKTVYELALTAYERIREYD